MKFDRRYNQIRDQEGVTYRVPGFGDTNTVEHLDPTKLGVYMAPFIKHLVTKCGYERGKDLRAAPYDFRRDPSK